MERRYAFFETGRGCLAGLAACAVVALVSAIVFLYLPAPGWVQLIAISAVASPLFWLAFRFDRPRDH